MYTLTSSERIRRILQTQRETFIFEGYMELLDGVSIYLPAAEAEMFRDDVLASVVWAS